MPSKKKLTLSVDERVIERARRYSTRHNTSISQLVTSYLSQLDAPSEANLAEASRDSPERHFGGRLPPPPRR